ncbi:MAG: hypothetical protein HC906_07305 [Bacteroidales bacterium]|nr:hypothetical protein [Bacteroidales bacterium]
MKRIILAALLSFVSLSSMKLFANPLISAIISADSVTCFGRADGKVNVQIFNGSEPYNVYLLKDDVISDPIDSIKNTTSENVTFTDLDIGRYWVLVEDNDGDADLSNSSWVYQPAAFSVSSIIIYKALSCYNSCDGKLKGFSFRR